MYGNNPKRPPLKGDGQQLQVQHIFKTIQGEGPNVGMPAIFIRLGGCNLACEFCDTEFEDFTLQPIMDIKNTVVQYSNNAAESRSVDLVVITGGEPLRQPINKLCTSLIDAGFKVQIETNGTLYQELPEPVEIICSPKAGRGKYFAIEPRLLPKITAFKFLISNDLVGYQTIPDLGQQKYNIPVFIQAIDQYNEQINRANKNLAVKLAIENGYRLSYQIHKELNIE